MINLNSAGPSKVLKYMLELGLVMFGLARDLEVLFCFVKDDLGNRQKYGV